MIQKTDLVAFRKDYDFGVAIVEDREHEGFPEYVPVDPLPL